MKLTTALVEVMVELVDHVHTNTRQLETEKAKNSQEGVVLFVAIFQHLYFSAQ
jgi:hypothetical protein